MAVEKRPYFCILLFMLTCSTCSALGQDPCLTSQHITVDDIRRSIDYPLKADGSGAIDDSRIVQLWYRFTGKTGSDIPTHCPASRMCNTLNPIWMNGTLPQDDGSIHQRTICVNSGGNCYNLCFTIEVKNCRLFPVYKLKPAPVPSSAYCAGQGKYHPPINRPVTRPQRPTMKLVETKNNFKFQCQLTNPDRMASHIVRWVADENVFLQQDIPPGVTLSEAREDQLRYREHSILGMHISCEVGAKDPSKDNREATSFVRSVKPGYFLGLKFVDRSGREISEIVIADDKTPNNIYIQSTVPVRCNSAMWQLHLKYGIVQSCSIRVRMIKPDLASISDEFNFKNCPTPVLIRPVTDFRHQLSLGHCAVYMKDTSWRNFRSHLIRILPILSIKLDDSKSRFLKVTVDPDYQDIWRNYEMPPLKVTLARSSNRGKRRSSKIIGSLDDTSYEDTKSALYNGNMDPAPKYCFCVHTERMAEVSFCLGTASCHVVEQLQSIFATRMGRRKRHSDAEGHGMQDTDEVITPLKNQSANDQ